MSASKQGYDRGGVLVRAGQTEGSVDLARLAGSLPAGIVCEIANDDGTWWLSELYDWECRKYLGFGLKWRNIPKPTIAAVQGKCIAGGLMLVWPCDIIIASDDAVFSDMTVTIAKLVGEQEFSLLFHKGTDCNIHFTIIE